MPSLPIPVFAALVLGFLFLHLWVSERRLGPLAALLGLCATQTLIISLAQHYRVPGMHVVQAITATFIPGLAWIAFQATAVRRANPRDAVHLAGPLLACGAFAMAPWLLDALIPGVFVLYGAAILWTCARGSDALPRLRLATGDTPVRIWQVIGVALMASALSDGLILLAQIQDAAHLKPWIITVFSVANLLLIGVLSLSGNLGAPDDPQDAASPVATTSDQENMARLQSLMDQEQPFLDPDLTLTKLSRRLRIPAKHLSQAINRTTGENVSRYINAARVEAAKVALTEGQSVTNAMLTSGFNTKSNFNREFLRVTGSSPSAWLKSA